MLLTFFVDSLSNPLFIVTICVPKRKVNMIRVDYQIIMRIVLGLGGVEYEERMWKHSPKSWGMPKYVMRKWSIWQDLDAIL